MIIITGYSEYSFQFGFLLLKIFLCAWMSSLSSGQSLLSHFLSSAVQTSPGKRGVAFRGQVQPQEANELSVFLFFVFERKREKERESEQGRSRERERGRIPSRLHNVSTEPAAGLELTNLEIVI